MNIRPKNNKILYADTGVKFSQNNLRGANWRQQVFNNYRQHLLDQLTKYGEKQDYGQWLNEMQSRHANIYSLAGGKNGNWENIAYKNDLVGQYQQDYRGGLGNDGQYKRFGSVNINPEDKYDFNQTGIKTNQGTRYNIANPPSRTSGDYSRDGYNYKVDNLYSAITDDRRLLGRKGDWDEASEDYKQWQKDLNARGWETYLDSDNYYKLRRLPNPDPKINPSTEQNPSQGTNQGTNQGTGGGIPVGEKADPESLWSKIGANLNKIAPDLLDALRLAGNMHNNERVYRESMKAIIPNLQQSYHTYRQVVGDEATKQAYYRRAAQGQTQAARPFTSDADRQMAYQMEAKRVGDELRAQGDLVDNQRIRETSAESAAHADANTERDTAVANSNLTELIKAKAAKHQLTAQKYSADWTNLEQYLMGKQYQLEKKKAEQKELERQLALLDTQEGLLGDDRLRELRDIADRDYTAYINEKDENKREALKKKFEESSKAYKLYQIQKSRENIKQQYGVYSAKEGTKIERKRKDDSLKYLYKTSRDVVEHFRKMSKMADDSRVKTMPKPIKLPSHPKKFQYGGVAPFTIYRPLGIGGESSYAQSTTSSSGSGKSEKDTAAKDKLDMIKELFKNIKGLPVDVAKVYQDIMGTLNKAKAFGEELSTDDLASMYLSSMQKMAQLKYSEDAYEKAKALATQNEALNEIAVGTSGEMVFQNLNTGEYKIGTIGSKMFKDKEWNPLTNDQILELRAKSPNMVFNDQMFNIVNNGVGLNKISAEIKSLAAGLSTTDRKIEGISEVQNNRVKAGLQILAGVQGTPDGYYKITQNSKDSRANVDAALNYIYSVLPTNYKTILAIHSGSEENSKGLILKYLTSQANNVYEESISPLTGKASDKNNSKESSEGLKLDAATALISGKGYQGAIEFNPGTSYAVTVNARHSGFQKKSGENMGSGITMQEATTSTLDKVLDWNKATLGGSRLNPTGYNRIMINSDDVVGIDLPVGSDKNTPDFTMLQKLQVLDQELLKKGIEDTPNNWKQINQVCQEIGLPAKYKNNGSLNEYSWNRFAAFQVTADDSVLVDKNAILSDILGVVEDDNVREQYEQAIQKDNKNYKLGSGFLGLGKQALYQGTVFVPINSSYVASALSGGQNISMQQATNLELRERGYDQQKIATYKPGININEL